MLLPQESPSSHKFLRMMADVCEAFVSSVFSVDYRKFVSIRVHSWFYKTLMDSEFRPVGGFAEPVVGEIVQ